MEFPANPANVEAAASKVTPPYDGWIRDYGRQKSDAALLLARLKIPYDWGEAHGVAVLMGEYGAYPPVSPPESRAPWFVAMRAAIAKLKMRNGLWGYDDGFGLGRSGAAEGVIKSLSH